MNIEIAIEQTANGFSAFVPELPGCVAAAETREETLSLMNEAIAFHLESLMLRRSIVALAPISATSNGAMLWTFENTPLLFVDIDAPLSSLPGVVVLPKIDVGPIVAAA